MKTCDDAVADALARLTAEFEQRDRAEGRQLVPAPYANDNGFSRREQPGDARVAMFSPMARRANRFFAERRPEFLSKRQIGDVHHVVVWRDEDELIARD